MLNEGNNALEITSENNVKKTGRGGKYNFPQCVEPEDADDVRTALATCLKWFDIGSQKAVTDEEWIERTHFFFQECINNGERPTWEKYCLAVGHPRSTVWAYLQGDKGATPARVDIIKMAKEFCASYDAEMVTTGKMRDTPYIFRAKNYYDMKDQQEVVLTPNNPLGEAEQNQELAEKYLESTASE